ncbi:hypothetical protein [Pacificoceanicola onchidii]|uniref:hypothetical protein n=1 Tax=Pacificoceanicola onchidii TaxID=2562685 RepID=UPI0019815CCE
MELLSGCSAIGRRPSYFDHGLSSCAPWNSVTGDLKEATVVLAYLLSLLERSFTFLIQAPKVSLDISDVEFEVLTNEFSKLMRIIRIVRNKRSFWSKASFGLRLVNKNHQRRKCPWKAGSAQPEVSETPYFLE